MENLVASAMSFLKEHLSSGYQVIGGSAKM